jgi:signal transduction histidine kinase
MRGTDRERFSSIAQAAQQMGGLTNDLLLLARAEEPMDRDLFAVDLSAAIEKLVRLYHSQFEARDIELTSHVPPGITVYGNPDQLERIFTNLLLNALRYTPDGGHVDIAGRQRREAISIHVRDTGIGITRDQIETVFDRFWRAESARTRSGGTGLGLPIARALAKRHGGDISVESLPGKGSDFVVTFPSRPPI